MIIHTLQYKHAVFVFDNVPAEVCSVCGDTILAPKTVKKLELMLSEKTTPEKLIPLYHYAGDVRREKPTLLSVMVSIEAGGEIILLIIGIVQGVFVMAHEGVEKIYRKISELSGSEKKILLTKLVTEIISHDSAAREIDIYDLKGVGKEVWNNIDAQEYVNSKRASWGYRISCGSINE